MLGLALTLSVCSVYFRDLEYLVGIALQLWFYLTPIVYSTEAVAYGLLYIVFLIGLAAMIFERRDFK